MSGYHTYFYMQLCRALKLLPVMLTVTLLVSGCVGIFSVLYLSSDEMTESSQKYRIAVVGDITDSYLGFSISALSVLDDSRFMLDFPVMTEDEARRALMSGEITAYAKVPDGLVESIVYGKNDSPVTLVGTTGQKGITGILAEELAEVASTLVVRSQSAIYGMQRLLWDNGMGDLWGNATEILNRRFIEMVLNRTRLCNLETLGMSNGLSTEGYYFCSMFVFYLILVGINSSPLFCRKSFELMRLMASRGVGAVRQVTGEYLSYLLMNLCCLFGIFLILGLVFESGAIRLPEWKHIEVGDLTGFYLSLIPVAAALAAMQFLTYELVSGVVSGVLLQFIIGISMAYLSGCFYPASMFPDALRRVGELLPTGLALNCADESLRGNISMSTGFGLLLYLAFFLGLSMFARSIRLRRG